MRSTGEGVWGDGVCWGAGALGRGCGERGCSKGGHKGTTMALGMHLREVEGFGVPGQTSIPRPVSINVIKSR